MICERHISLVQTARDNAETALKQINILEDGLNRAIVEGDSEAEWILNSQNTLNKIASCLEGQKSNLSELVYGLRKKRNKKTLYTFPFDHTEVKEDGKILAITINDIPPLRGRVGNKSFNRWRNIVSSAIKGFYGGKVTARKSIFVWFEIHMRNTSTDIDNYTLRALTNGIVLSGLIKDDNILSYAFGFKGIKSAKEFTKITIK